MNLASLWILVVICVLRVSFILSCLFLAAFWSPAGKELTSWLSFNTFSCVFATFSNGVLGQVWCLIVLAHDLCLLTYFDI